MISSHTYEDINVVAGKSHGHVWGRQDCLRPEGQEGGAEEHQGDQLLYLYLLYCNNKMDQDDQLILQNWVGIIFGDIFSFFSLRGRWMGLMRWFTRWPSVSFLFWWWWGGDGVVMVMVMEFNGDREILCWVEFRFNFFLTWNESGFSPDGSDLVCVQKFKRIWDFVWNSF